MTRRLARLTRLVLLFPLVMLVASSASATTWFIRADGGNRYDANVYTPGQCNGKYDAPYPGSGTNQNCAFNDPRFMIQVGTYGDRTTLMQPGDTLVLRSAKPTSTQQNQDSNPRHMRIGCDSDRTGGTPAQQNDFWCNAGGVDVSLTGIAPSGTSAQHTRVLAGCAYDVPYSCTPVSMGMVTAPANNNWIQLFLGFGVGPWNLPGIHYVDIEGIEFTTHNGVCARYGAVNPLPGCQRGSPPLSDQADQALNFSNTTGNIFLQDVFIHGFSSNGIGGPIGAGAITFNRVAINFNTFAAWNFDDGTKCAPPNQNLGCPTPNDNASQLIQSYVTMIGNGCQEEYPITHGFPAKGCWDSNTGGFGDAWSGQNSGMAAFSCDHCFVAYNTKDGAIGPHTTIVALSWTNSIEAANQGAQGKWGQYGTFISSAGATALFQNDLMIGNCAAMLSQLPGAVQNFNQNTGLTGSGLTGCRGGIDLDYYSGVGATSAIFDHLTIVSYDPIITSFGCGGSGSGQTCPTYQWTNNIVYAMTSTDNGDIPGIFADHDGATHASSNSLQFGTFRNGDTCGGTILCSDPLLVNEPTGTIPPQSKLYNLNFSLASNSPAKSAAGSSTRTTDFTGATATNDLGALNRTSTFIMPTFAVTPPTPPLQFTGYILVVPKQ